MLYGTTLAGGTLMDLKSIIGVFRAGREVANAAGTISDKLRGRPPKAEREELVRYLRLLDERRVFSAPYNVEVFESCVWSLQNMKDATEQALSRLDHPLARAPLGAILDQLREFLDRWRRHPRMHGAANWDSVYGGLGPQQAAFFEDLGEVRAVVRLMVQATQDLEPLAKAPHILEDRRPDPRA